MVASTTVKVPSGGGPRQSFWMPGRDEGLAFVSGSGAPWQTVPAGITDTITLAEHPRIKRRWRREWEAWQSETVFRHPVMFDSRLAVASNLVVAGDFQILGGKFLISGPSGSRAIGHNFREVKRAGNGDAWPADFAAYCEEAHPDRVPSYDGSLSQLDLVIDARSLKNYFHFVVEILPAFAIAANTPGFDGRIKVIASRPDVSGFVHSQISALFPELASRYDILTGPQTFERALIAWHDDMSYLANPAQHIAGLYGAENSLSGPNLPPRTPKVLGANGNFKALNLVRARALEKIEGHNFDHFPRRFWVGRRSTPGHDRNLKNEADVMDLLKERGFGQVMFEDLTPLEQIGVMHNAEMMISVHGAGFTNMMYAAPDSHLIELGTLQTGKIRWDDFASLAHLGRCHYTVAIADYEYDGPEIIPPMRGNGIYPVRMGNHATTQLMNYIDNL